MLARSLAPQSPRQTWCLHVARSPILHPVLVYCRRKISLDCEVREHRSNASIRQQGSLNASPSSFSLKAGSDSVALEVWNSKIRHSYQSEPFERFAGSEEKQKRWGDDGPPMTLASLHPMTKGWPVRSPSRYEEAREQSSYWAVSTGIGEPVSHFKKSGTPHVMKKLTLSQISCLSLVGAVNFISR